MIVQVEDKQYDVKVATTNQKKKKGLQGVDSLKETEGILFIYDTPENVSFWMKDTSIPLDIIFFNQDQEAIKVAKGIPNDETPITCEEVQYVLEVNQGSGIKEGDQLELDSDEQGPVMQVLNKDGSTQMDLWGNERIFSRQNTKVLIRKAKKADLSKKDVDYKDLGRYMFKCIKKQDSNTPEYVQLPK